MVKKEKLLGKGLENVILEPFEVDDFSPTKKRLSYRKAGEIKKMVSSIVPYMTSSGKIRVFYDIADGPKVVIEPYYKDDEISTLVMEDEKLSVFSIDPKGAILNHKDYEDVICFQFEALYKLAEEMPKKA